MKTSYRGSPGRMLSHRTYSWLATGVIFLLSTFEAVELGSPGLRTSQRPLIDMLFPSAIAAESEDFSNWNWDEVPLESNREGTSTPSDSTTIEDQTDASSSAETVTSPQDVAETPSAAEESTSLQTEPDTPRQETAISESSPIPPEPDKGAMELDLDWPEDIQVDDQAADVTTTRRTTQANKPAGPAKKSQVGSTAAPDLAANLLEGYPLFGNMRPYTVIPSQKDLDMHPCLDCHEWVESDLTPRRLKEPHDNFRLKHGLHGKGGFWCFTCHHLEGDGGLKTLEGDKLSFDDAYILCSQCHSQEAKDWSFGAHGKRVDNWQGERRILNCTACHYQHQPRYDPRKPMPGPSLRMGLNRPGHPAQGTQASGHRHKVVRVWERYTNKQGQEQPHTHEE